MKSAKTTHSLLEGAVVFSLALAFFMLLGARTPFYRGSEGVCELGAILDVLRGNWILPHYGPEAESGAVAVAKPPLYQWTAALFVRALGWNETAIRAPSMVAGALTCAVLYAWLASAVGRGTAFWSALVLATCHLFGRVALDSRMDEMLALFVTGAAASLERVTDDEGNWRVTLLVVAGVCMAMATMTKSLLGFVLPGLALGVFLAWRGSLRVLLRRDILAAFGFAFILAGVWYAAAFSIGGIQFLKDQLFEELWLRFVAPKAAPAILTGSRPLGYFAPRLIGQSLPWSFYFPALLMLLWVRRGQVPRPIVFSACWFTSSFLLFSASSGKRLIYLAPVLPPLAVLLGWLVAETTADDTGEPGSRRLYTACNVTAAIGTLLLLVAASSVLVFGVPGGLFSSLNGADRDFLALFISVGHNFTRTVLAYGAFILIGTGITLVAALRRRVGLEAPGLAIIALAGSLFWMGVMYRGIATAETLKWFALRVNSLVPVGEPVAAVDKRDCDLAVYMTGPLGEVKHFTCDSSPTVRYLILTSNSFAALNPQARACLTPITASAPIDKRGRRILVRRDAPTRF